MLVLVMATSGGRDERGNGEEGRKEGRKEGVEGRKEWKTSAVLDL